MVLEEIKNEEPLGVKHKKYNELLKDAIAKNHQLDETEFQPVEQDLDNLLKIDIASHQRNVDYIISVLKCKDMLYVSRALNKSQWLLEDHYAHIINPQYLHEQLLPQMMTKATIKLSKFIRQYLKNEARIEEFFKGEPDPKVAVKWLSRCSVPFIERNVRNYTHIMDVTELKRLYERSLTIFEATTVNNENCRQFLQAASFLLNTHTEMYLDVVERVPRFERPSFNSKATKLIMKKLAERVKDKFDIYSNLVNIPTFVKHIKREEVKAFLYKQCNDTLLSHDMYGRWCKFTAMKHFVSRMPKEEQFNFVKKHFIDKIVLQNVEKRLDLTENNELFAAKLCEIVNLCSPSYVWYEFAPFDVAITDIVRLIRSETDDSEKYSMLKVLLICARNDMVHLQSVFLYYKNQHLRDDIYYQSDFIKDVIAYTNITKYDETTWNILETILTKMDIYDESACSTEQKCIDIVILHNVLQNKPIPNIIQNKFTFSTFNHYQKKLNNEQQNKVFNYLFEYARNAIERQNIICPKTFNTAISRLDNLLNLLLDWNKPLNRYPYALDKIRDFIKIKKENNWKLDLAQFYNKNKSWRNLMFEESVIMNPSENVCVNALKHDPELLSRYKFDVESLCLNDAVSLKNLLTKLRIYWPHSLAAEWLQFYFSRLDKLEGHKALVRGICTILPQNDLNNLLQKYAPKEAKVDWANTDELCLSLQKIIAKNMHIARPQPSPDNILMYAKGDYLQYAMPSLFAIYYNLSRVDSQEHVPKLLNAPVSLQKHGIRIGFLKLEHNDLKLHMPNIWKTSKNCSIRSVTFQVMFELLCNAPNDDKAKDLFEFVADFIDNLNFQEDEKIYEKFSDSKNVPLCVRPKFIEKSYKFLKSLIQNTKRDPENYKYYLERMLYFTKDIIELISPEFVANILAEFTNDKFLGVNVRSNDGFVIVMSAYLLSAKDKDVQIQRYEETLSPLVKRSLAVWNVMREGTYFIRGNVQELLKRLSDDLKNYVFENKMIIPTKMFAKIQHELKILPVSENYLTLTMWNFTVKLAELMELSNERDDWNKLCSTIAPELGKFCLEYLKQDVKKHFSCIYVLFSMAFEMTYNDLLSMDVKFQIYELMLADSGFIQAYLATLLLHSKDPQTEDHKQKADTLRKIIEHHPSVEVKMHYYSKFKFED